MSVQRAPSLVKSPVPIQKGVLFAVAPEAMCSTWMAERVEVINRYSSDSLKILYSSTKMASHVHGVLPH